MAYHGIMLFEFLQILMFQLYSVNIVNEFNVTYSLDTS